MTAKTSQGASAAGEARPALTGVMGWPIGHSKSPLIHNYWRKLHGVSGVYAPLAVAPQAFEALVSAARALGYVGLNVTTPHKEAAYLFASDLTPAAEQSRSVNTLTLAADGAVLGDSTDGFGFLENLQQRAGWTAQGRRVTLLGAGGAARAVAVALLRAGATEVRVANRTPERATLLVDALSQWFDRSALSVWPWPVSDAVFDGADLIVNATTVGMSGGGAETDGWRLPPLAPTVVATDLVYAPLETPFLTAAAAAGAQTVDGLGMLLHQARPGFAAWHGVWPTVDETLRQQVLSGSGCFP